MGFKNATVGQKIKFAFKFGALACVALTHDEFINAPIISNNDLGLGAFDELHQNAQRSLMLVQAEDGYVEIRRRNDGMLIGKVSKEAAENLNEGMIMSDEEFTNKFDKINQSIAIIGGEAYRKIYSEKELDESGKPKLISFEKLQNSNRNLFNKLEGTTEFIDLVKLLSGDEVVVTDRKENDKNGVDVQLYNLQDGTQVEGDLKTVAATYFKEIGVKSKIIEAMFGKAGEIKKESFNKEDLLISAGEEYTRDIYDVESVVAGCSKTKDGNYIVENSSLIRKLDRAESLVEIIDKIHEIDDSERETLEVEVIDYLCDDKEIPDKYVGKFYDFLIQGKVDPKFRREYVRRLESTNDTKLRHELTRIKGITNENIYTDEQVDEMTFEEKVEALENRAEELDALVSSGYLSDRDEGYRTKEFLIVKETILQARQRQLYKDTDKYLEKVEEKEREEEEQRDNVAKMFGAEEYSMFNRTASQAKKNKILDGQETFYVDGDGEVMFGEEVVASKRAYNKNESQVKISAKSLAEEDFEEGTIDEIVSSEELEQVEDGQMNIFDLMNNENGVYQGKEVTEIEEDEDSSDMDI